MGRFHHVGARRSAQTLRNGRLVFELTEIYDFECTIDEVTHRVIVPVGFRTDGASIPWLFRRLLPANGLYTPAAVVHDYLYLNRGDHGAGRVSRKTADRIFLEGMKALAVPAWQRGAIYRAVRTFGGRGWGS